MDTLVSLKVFAEIVTAGSFVAAAERLTLSPPMVSKHLAHLERELGVRLLNRTSRRISLTEAGTLYFEQSKQALDILQRAAVAIGRSVEIPRGVLKVTVPVWFANERIVGIMRAYRMRYPEVLLDMRFSNRKVDLAAEGYDLALRVTRDPSPHLIARPLCDIAFYLVATPGYFDARPVPQTIAELMSSEVILPSYLEVDTLPFEGPRGHSAVRLPAAMKSDDSTFTLLAVRAGMALASLPEWLVEDDLRAGRLIHVLPTQHRPQQRLYATYVSRKYLTPKVRTFIDFLVEALGGEGQRVSAYPV